jgi:dTDP-4-dehydrorhamnose 3,5-epimerase
MKFIQTDIPDVLLIKPQVFEDQRGFFMEMFREEQFVSMGINTHFVQENHSGSCQGILRGLHYQIQQAQGKLVRAITGEIFDVVVDLRRSSPTFGRWIGEKLSSENKLMLWVPQGFAHGFYVLSDWAEVLYKTTDYYAPTWERSLLWSDPALAINWPLLEGNSPILSEKDSLGRLLSEADLFE